MSEPQFKGPSEMVLAAWAARQFYFAHRSKVQIADELGISRFEVARLLHRARATGIVRITVASPGTVNLDLSSRLCEEFGLQYGLAVDTADGSDAQIREQVGQCAADLLSEIMTPDDVLGVGWARVVLEMASRVHSLRARRIVQFTGALSRADVDVSAVEVVRDLARRAGVPASVFYAPMLVSDGQAAAALYRQPEVADAVEGFKEVTKAVVGVGGWVPPHSTLYDALTPEERVEVLRDGAHGDLSGVLLDVHGRPVQSAISERIISITAEQLRGVPQVIGLAYGMDKVTAARAALRGGYLQGLVTHSSFAEGLLSGPGE